MTDGAPMTTLRVARIAAPLRAQAYEVLREAIIDGRFAPGQRLIERELIEQLGVSRTTIREVLRELDVSGLVTSIPNKGTVVVELTPAIATQLMEVHQALESLAARRFAAHATEEDVAALKAAFGAYRETVAAGGDVRAVVEAKDHFFAALLDGAHNGEIRPILRQIQDRVRIVRVASLSQRSRADAVVKELRAILKAATARDAEATVQACMTHLDHEFTGGLAILAAAAPDA